MDRSDKMFDDDFGEDLQFILDLEGMDQVVRVPKEQPGSSSHAPMQTAMIAEMKIQEVQLARAERCLAEIKRKIMHDDLAALGRSPAPKRKLSSMEGIVSRDEEEEAVGRSASSGSDEFLQPKAMSDVVFPGSQHAERSQATGVQKTVKECYAEVLEELKRKLHISTGDENDDQQAADPWSPIKGAAATGQGKGSAKVCVTPYEALAMLPGVDLIAQIGLSRLVTVSERRQQGNPWGVVDVPVEREQRKERVRHYWQCRISCGGMEVKADAILKDMAKEVACYEFLTKMLPLLRPNVELPEFESPSALFLEPYLLEEVVDMSQVRKELTREPGMKKLYTFTLQLGSQTFQGVHDILEYAMSVATAKAYRAISGREPTGWYQFFTGQECFDSNLYELQETEIYHLFQFPKAK